jgi:hypothetical protein
MNSNYSLKQPLPIELQPSQKSAYHRFPVFSWPWYWRRGAVVGPFAAFIGAALAWRVGLDTGDWLLAADFAYRAVAVWVGITLVGPALATWVRERGWGAKRERRTLRVVVVIFIALGFVAKAWYESYYIDEIVPVLQAHGKGHRELPGMVLNGIETLNLSGLFFDWFYKLFFAFVIVAMGGGYPLLMYFRELRAAEAYRSENEIRLARRQRDAADSKLMVLQAQVEPHFLYNTLASVRSLVSSDPSRAVATLDALVDHLRATLPKLRDRDNARANLAEQTEICRSYLEVMRVRTGDRLRYSIDIPDDCRSLFFPPLMLISLVENAVKHGIEPKPGSCAIDIAARRKSFHGAESLEVSVLDDGAGLREGASGGIGLANIRAQLATRYQDRAELSLQGRETGGVAARIVIPIEHS